jgi:putative transposase
MDQSIILTAAASLHVMNTRIVCGNILCMSRKGDCWDNALKELFFRSLKSKCLVFFRFATSQSANLEVIDYISSYNADRVHSAIYYVSP